MHDIINKYKYVEEYKIKLYARYYNSIPSLDLWKNRNKNLCNANNNNDL
jgi:hypothetical protein